MSTLKNPLFPVQVASQRRLSLLSRWLWPGKSQICLEKDSSEGLRKVPGFQAYDFNNCMLAQMAAVVRKNAGCRIISAPRPNVK